MRPEGRKVGVSLVDASLVEGLDQPIMLVEENVVYTMRVTTVWDVTIQRRRNFFAASVATRYSLITLASVAAALAA